ncbi:cardiolipin synthase [Dongia mobilis]|uniref:cardiolipin synthase n=1 Tax=Dongia sp. TaxID=1977262 RepID=UPI0026F2702A
MIEGLAFLAAEWLTILHVLLAAAVTFHVLLYKRDVRSAAGWMGLAWLSPVIGSVLYALFGINRVQRKAARILRRRRALHQHVYEEGAARGDYLAPLQIAVGRITRRPTQAGNAVKLLRNGDEAYPAMLAAIGAAKTSIALSSYIFENDAAGAQFIAALVTAQAREVEIRVILDGIGSGYIRAPAFARLRREGINVARFMHSFVPWHMAFLNLRSHKKILVVDGRVAFLGGINISSGNLLKEKPRHPIRDEHFEVKGPVVAQIMEAFAADWIFTTGEELRGNIWFPPLTPAGGADARIITSGPDQDIDKIEFMFLQAIGCARQSIKVVTPYFLPEDHLITALSLAAMRGVAVEVVVPADSDHAFIDWATRAHVEPFLQAGGHIWRAPKPFEHSKLFTIDGNWSLVGSANWDVRSMRLNFEINIEIYDSTFAREIEAEVERKKGRAFTLKRLKQRPFLIRLRDRAARLFLPYL